jgi:transposase-like protein
MQCDADAAKRFLQGGLHSAAHSGPRVINVDGNPVYPKVIAELSRQVNSVHAAAVVPFAISTP